MSQQPTSTLLTINDIYVLLGVMIMYHVVLTLKDSAHPKRLTTGLFWGLFGMPFLFGDLSVSLIGEKMTHLAVGVMVIGLAILAGTGQVSIGRYEQVSHEDKQASASRLGNKVFMPAILIPIITVICTLGLKGVSVGGTYLLDQSHLTLAALTFACALALLIGWWLTGGSPKTALGESRKMLDSIGWVAILPQMLAMLGGVFVVAQAGDAITHLVTMVVDPNNRFMLVVIYCVGMALFTMIMGNAFAAFPVMTAGIALPFLINMHHASPAPLMALGMYSGYCGTLLTPMAANFNILPVALMELDDKYKVIKVQAPTALILLTFNIILMYLVVFHD